MPSKLHLWKRSSIKLENAPYLLMFIMAVGVLIVVGATIWLLYNVGYEEQRQRLIEMVQNRAHVIKTIAKYESEQ